MFSQQSWLKVQFFRYMTPCALACRFRRFGLVCSLCLQGIQTTVMTSLRLELPRNKCLCHCTRRHIQEDWCIYRPHYYSPIPLLISSAVSPTWTVWLFFNLHSHASYILGWCNAQPSPSSAAVNKSISVCRVCSLPIFSLVDINHLCQLRALPQW